MEPLLTPKQLADLLGLSVQTLYNRRSLGASMPVSVHIGNQIRFRQSDVDRWLASLPSGRTARDSDSPDRHQPASMPRAVADADDEPSRGCQRRRGRPTKAEQVLARQRALGLPPH